MSSTLEHEDGRMRKIQVPEQLSRLVPIADRKSTFKPYTARVVPHLTVNDVQIIHHSTNTGRDRFVMLEDSINSTKTVKP
jgi:hypothetical protein